MEQVAKALEKLIEDGKWKHNFIYEVEKIGMVAYIKEGVDIDTDDILAIFSAIIRIYGSN